jgi:excisionase family DNA binding protein
VKAELTLDTQELVRQITQEVIKAITPLLRKGTAGEDLLFTVKTLAKYLAVSDQWVYERVHSREIPFIKVGKFPRFRKSDIDRWLETLKTSPIHVLSRPSIGISAKQPGRTS